MLRQSYLAPFAPGGEAGIDAALCDRVLAVALMNGGDYADLFFEYRKGSGFSYDEGILKSASRSTSMGLGVRVQRGDATGYAYTEDLAFDAMKPAAETAARIATGGGGVTPVKVESRGVPSRYELDTFSIDEPALEKRALLERASLAALAADPMIIRAEAGFAAAVREILIATSDGRLCFDVQPMIRFTVRTVAERDGKRQSGSSGGGGRITMGYFDHKSPEWHAKEAARRAIVMLDAVEAPATQMAVALAPGDSGILLHEPLERQIRQLQLENLGHPEVEHANDREALQRQPCEVLPLLAELLEEAFPSVGREMGRNAEELDRDGTLEAKVKRPVDDAEAALACNSVDAVPSVDDFADETEGVGHRAGTSSSIPSIRQAFSHRLRGIIGRFHERMTVIALQPSGCKSRQPNRAAKESDPGKRPVGNGGSAACRRSSGFSATGRG